MPFLKKMVLLSFFGSLSTGLFVGCAPTAGTEPQATQPTAPHAPSDKPSLYREEGVEVVRGGVQGENLKVSYDEATKAMTVKGQLQLTPYDGGPQAVIDVSFAGQGIENNRISLKPLANEVTLPPGMNVAAKATCIDAAGGCSASFIDIYVQYQDRIYHHQIETAGSRPAVKPTPTKPPTLADLDKEDDLKPATVDDNGEAIEEDDESDSPSGPYIGDIKGDLKDLFDVDPKPATPTAKASPSPAPVTPVVPVEKEKPATKATKPAGKVPEVPIFLSPVKKTEPKPAKPFTPPKVKMEWTPAKPAPKNYPKPVGKDKFAPEKPAEKKPAVKPAPEVKPTEAKPVPVEDKPKAKPEPKSEPKPEAKPEVMPEPKPAPKPPAKPEVKPQPKPEVKPKPEPQDDGNSKSDAPTVDKPMKAPPGAATGMANLNKKIYQVMGKSGEGYLQNALNLFDLSKKKAKPGFYIARPENQTHYGSNELIYMIQKMGAFTLTQDPDYSVRIGTLSKKSGGPIMTKVKGRDVRAHLSHTSGVDADISYYFKDPAQQGQKALSANGTPRSDWLIEMQWGLFKTFNETKLVDRIFIHRKLKKALCLHAISRGEINKDASSGVAFETLWRLQPRDSDHADHFHLRAKCSLIQQACDPMNEPVRTTGCF